MSSRRKIVAGTGLYHSTVPTRIAGYSPLIPADLAADTEEAVAALKNFDGYAQQILKGSPMPADLPHRQGSNWWTISQIS
ncbi:MAG: hypothetical protein LBU38_04835 [Propionibacteriaceae bacterium]|jgi:hypothetical protein|nr:hypothetical protein [Propionibacteriaceae bacterium]